MLDQLRLLNRLSLSFSRRSVVLLDEIAFPMFSLCFYLPRLSTSRFRPVPSQDVCATLDLIRYFFILPVSLRNFSKLAYVSHRLEQIASVNLFILLLHLNLVREMIVAFDELLPDDLLFFIQVYLSFV